MPCMNSHGLYLTTKTFQTPTGVQPQIMVKQLIWRQKKPNRKLSVFSQLGIYPLGKLYYNPLHCRDHPIFPVAHCYVVTMRAQLPKLQKPGVPTDSSNPAMDVQPLHCSTSLLRLRSFQASCKEVSHPLCPVHGRTHQSPWVGGPEQT